MPLRHSRVLEGVNLIGTGANENPTPFLWNLRPLIHHKLFCVRLPEACMQNPSESILEFMGSLREAKLEQARDQGTRCDCCNAPVMEETRQLVPNKFGVPQMQCFWCYRRFCRRGSCSAGVRECHRCGEAYCEECEVAYPCDFLTVGVPFVSPMIAEKHLVAVNATRNPAKIAKV